MQSIIHFFTNIQNHLSLFWDFIIGLFLVLAGFLLSKKALLAVIYYCFNFMKISMKFIKRIFIKKQQRDAYQVGIFWGQYSHFQTILQSKQQEKQKEFYNWILESLEQKKVSEEEIKDLDIISLFLKYSLLSYREQKDQLWKDIIDGQNKKPKE